MVNLSLPNSFRTKTIIILVKIYKKRMIIINMIKTIISSIISKIQTSRTNRSITKTWSPIMRDSKLKSNSQLFNNQFKSNKNIIGKNRTILTNKNR